MNISGTETTATFLEWCIYYLVKYPKVQEDMANELQSKFAGRPVNLRDSALAPYTMAVVEEVTRHNPGKTNYMSIEDGLALTVSCLNAGFQVSVPHYTMADTHLTGLGAVPKDTKVIQFMYPSNNDPIIFPNPDKFDPQRFYDSVNDVFINIASDKRSLFGLGKRRCLGEALAKAEIFMFTARLVQEFKIACDPEDVKELEGEAVPGVPSTPRPFRIILEER